MNMHQLRTWNVEGVLPATESTEHRYNKNVNLEVIALSLEDAVAAVKERYPTFQFAKVMTSRWIEAVIIADN